MDKVTRWNALVEMLGAAEGGRLSIEEASDALGVSVATVRRDFDELANQQMLSRVRGGAVSNGSSFDLPLRYKTTRHAAEKLRVAELAARLVRGGQVVGLNGGTTTTQVARVLAGRSQLLSDGFDVGVTVVTNALNIANELTVYPRLKVVVVGGVARHQSYELLGPLAAQTLEGLTLDIAILGVDAVDASTGASAHNEGEASINALMASRAKERIVVADGSKVGKSAFSRIMPADRIDTLVTDASAPAEAVEALEAAGCRVVRA